MQTKPKPLLWTSVVLFLIGFIIAPAIALLHVPQEVGQALIGFNFICGGWGFFVLAQIEGELG